MNKKNQKRQSRFRIWGKSTCKLNLEDPKELGATNPIPCYLHEVKELASVKPYEMFVTVKMK